MARVERAGEKMPVEGSSRRQWRGDTKVPLPPADAVWPCGGGENRQARVKRETAVLIMGIMAPLYSDRTKKGDDERFELLHIQESSQKKPSFLLKIVERNRSILVNPFDSCL